jgi:hypothetical protein
MLMPMKPSGPKGGAEEEADHAVEAVLLEGRGDAPSRGTTCGGGEEDQDGQRDDDHHDGPELAGRNAWAPSWIAGAISFILPVPWSKASTLRASKQAGDDADDAGDQADVEPGLVGAAEVEGW